VRLLSHALGTTKSCKKWWGAEQTKAHEHPEGSRMSRESSAAEKMIGDFAPNLLDLTDRVLFGDVWERRELSKRDRSLATVAALIAMNRPEQLRFHLDNALKNG